jgi:hypothetical protein
LVEEEIEARGIGDAGDPGAAPVIARVLRETAERLAVELEAERDPPPDDAWDDDPEWDAPAIPYGDAELGRVAHAVVDATPALDAALGRFLEALPKRRRRGVLKRARRAWEAAGVRDPDDLAGRDAVRRALVAEALQEGFDPPARTVEMPPPREDDAEDQPGRLLARVPDASEALVPVLEQALARLGAAAVQETLDQAAFLALRGALRGAAHERWVSEALRRR